MGDTQAPEPERVVRIRRAQLAVTTIVAEAELSVEAVQAVLAAIGRELGWGFAAYWSFDARRNLLTCAHAWARADAAFEHFVAASMEAELRAGEGLPGSVWAAGKARWLEVLEDAPSFTRIRAARAAGLISALAFPVLVAGNPVAVIELADEVRHREDPELLEVVSAIGGQLGMAMERWKAAEAVRESEAVKASVLATALDAVITIDAQGIVREFNPAAEAIFGFSRGEVVGRELAELIVPLRYRKAHREGLQRFLATGESHILNRRVELSALRSDGAEIPVELSVAPIEVGRKRLFTAFVRDISQRKTEADRREFMAEASEIFTSDLELGRVLTSVAKLAVPRIGDWCAIDLVAADGSVERVAIEHSQPEKVALAQLLVEKYPAPKDAAHGVPMVLRSGEPEWMREVIPEEIDDPTREPEHLDILRKLAIRSYVLAPLTARGRTFGVLSLVHSESGRRYGPDDVRFIQDFARRASLAVDNALLFRESKARAAALDAERRALEALNETTRLISAELDLERIVQAVTDAATSLSDAAFGAFFYTVVGESGEALLLYTVSGAPREAFSRFPHPRKTALFAPTFAGEQVLRLDDVTRDDRYGKSAPHFGMPEGHLPVRSYLAVPVVSRSGGVIGGLFFGHPEPGVFSERAEKLVVALAAQAAIAMDNARLFEEAQRLIKALENSNRELDQFAYVISHDLKAPLRGMASLSQWIEEDLGDRITPEARSKLELLRRRADRMQSLIDGVLSYSRAGRQRGEPELIELYPLLEETIELLQPPPGSTIEIQKDLPSLFTERVPLQQVFMNLLGNALKHAKRGDVVVRVEGSRDGALHHFRICDNGAGIEPEYHERIFGLFQTLEARDREENTGIGLAIVRKIAEAHGGRAWVESQPGQGAAFHVTWRETEGRR